MWNNESVRQAGIDAAPAGDATAKGKSGGSGAVQVPHLGRSVQVKGEVTASEDLSVDGHVEGRIDLPEHILTVGPNAVIRADITAKIVTIFGTVVGSVTAHEKVDLRGGGSVEGHVVCAILAVQDGATLCGKVEAQGGRRSALGADTGGGSSATVAAGSAVDAATGCWSARG